MTPLLTVALPLYNSGDIAWLALESLCRQQTTFEWELITMEETTPNAIGAERIEAYRDRLKKAGCIKLHSYELKNKIALSIKWLEIAKRASGRYFVLQAADCYSHPTRLQQTVACMGLEHEWYQQEQGLFYFILNGKVIRFERPKGHPCGLNMATLTDKVKDMAKNHYVDIHRSVDYWLYRWIKPSSVYYDETLYLDGVDTHGMNNISTRDRHFNNPVPPYYPTMDRPILPKVITAKLKALI